MAKEQYENIVKYIMGNIGNSILEKISKFVYKELDGLFVIEVYVKEGMKAKNLDKIFTTIQDYTK